ncbi:MULTISPECIES: Trp biosynthesis-associated membrane protein [Protofrankia]|uniref:Trp biosynthesis associated, transmembrane protein, Oprn/Chp n=1 Tax=Candidatus Protofrankia datiscae TaxID=2716812 RepID=F8B5R7_9ACTN|nr:MULTISPECIES: Trp biosynthesis-associated membrane protein [Protofrankia]AEH10155.1 Trp biosynthesis associated, transmembrane protein, Oprn/Chp [Candidatus Protofrankia datiscae]
MTGGAPPRTPSATAGEHRDDGTRAAHDTTAPGAPADHDASAAGGGRAAAGRRREMAVAVAACLLGAAVVLLTVGATWVRVRVAATVADEPVAAAAPLAASLSGSELAPALAGLGLVGLAGVVAIAATRRAGRVVVGVLVLLAGVAAAVVAGRIAADPLSAARATARVRDLAPGATADLRDLRRTAAPWLAAAGGVLLAGGGLLVALRGRTWSALSARYRSPAARPVDAWEAIDRGDDPT